MATYFCAGKHCPGLPYRASDRWHPPSCGGLVARRIHGIEVARPADVDPVDALEAPADDELEREAPAPLPLPTTSAADYAAMAARVVFDLRSRQGRRNVEVHLAELELVAFLREAFQVGFEAGALEVLSSTLAAATVDAGKPRP